MIKNISLSVLKCIVDPVAGYTELEPVRRKSAEQQSNLFVLK